VKITIDLDRTNIDFQRFENKADWESFIYQYRPHRGFYNPQPQDMRPMKFPCAMISTSTIIGRPDGNDEYWNHFLYDGEYQVEE
jgi:hypothetical protein